MPKCTLVISAVNFSEGGPLTVLRECLKAASETLPDHWQVIALVHDKFLFEPATGTTYVEFPLAKRSWFLRVFYEWFYFHKLSKKLKPDLWISLHDITPRVIARRQAVYCHNPAPFFNVTLREALLDPKLFLFNRFYKHLYALRISKNNHVVVQQSWLRKEFMRRFHLDEVVVAYPELKYKRITRLSESERNKQKIVFFYPALPRVPKNMEVIFEAVRLLGLKMAGQFEVRLTIDGKENAYARSLAKKYADVTGIVFVGRLNRTQMIEQYLNSDCVLFPSRLETWGLPISEAKVYGLPLLLADLPYAHETVGTYDRVCFFDPLDAKVLANLIERFVDGQQIFQSVSSPPPDQPFVQSWPELIRFLVNDIDCVSDRLASEN